MGSRPAIRALICNVKLRSKGKEAQHQSIPMDRIAKDNFQKLVVALTSTVFFRNEAFTESHLGIFVSSLSNLISAFTRHEFASPQALLLNVFR